MRKSTTVVRSHLAPAVNGEALTASPVLSGPFHASGDPAASAYTYGRFHNPTWTTLENALAALESSPTIAAKALVFPSGMAAVTAVFEALLRPGGTVVLPANGYYTVRMLLERFFSPIGVGVRFLPKQADLQGEALRGATLLWLETPTNPELDIYDIRVLSQLAHAAGALVAVDNTTATPLAQNVLSLGADYSVVSGTKALTGQSDLILGHVAVAQEELLKPIHEWRTLSGSILGPMEAWLALRSLPSLPLRLERASANALAIAGFLAGRSDILRVLYPGLPSHPGHEIAAQQMDYFGPVVSFVLEDRARAERFLARAELVTEATSFGGIVTTAERRARWPKESAHPGLIRMSAGCEAIEDILNDLENALA